MLRGLTVCVCRRRSGTAWSTSPPPKGPFSGAGLGVTAVVAMVLCCAAPALLAGGLLASLGAVIRSPAVVALGVAVAGGAVAYAVGPRRRACSPGSSSDETKPADRPPHWSLRPHRSNKEIAMTTQAHDAPAACPTPRRRPRAPRPLRVVAVTATVVGVVVLASLTLRNNAADVGPTSAESAQSPGSGASASGPLSVRTISGSTFFGRPGRRPSVSWLR